MKLSNFVSLRPQYIELKSSVTATVWGGWVLWEPNLLDHSTAYVKLMSFFQNEDELAFVVMFLGIMQFLSLWSGIRPARLAMTSIMATMWGFLALGVYLSGWAAPVMVFYIIHGVIGNMMATVVISIDKRHG